MKRVLVVGGGFAGVAAASAAAEAGLFVTLLEAHGHLGGRSASSAPSDMFPAPFDNSPHLFMGCYRETLRLFARVGGAEEIRWHDPISLAWLVPGGRRVSLGAWPLPAPLHLAAGLWISNAFPGSEKRALLSALRSLTLPDLSPELRDLTVAAFLERVPQGRYARERFWVPLTRSVMNLDPKEAPLSLFASALRRVFSGRRFDSALGIARFPLSDVLFPRLPAWLAARGGEVFLNRAARGFTRHHGLFALRDSSGQVHEAEALIWAVPPWFLNSLLGEGAPADDPASLEKSPIVSVNILLDREVVEGAFAGLSGGRFDWVFNRNENWGWRAPSGRGQYLSFVASAAADLASRGDGEILSLAVGELRDRLPARRAAFEVRASKVVREMAATPKLAPGALRHRSATATKVPGLFLAGDWTDTTLPATIEGAVLSGHRAAEAARETLGTPSSRPDGA